MSGYIGPIPVPQGIQNKETFTATAGQTTFNTNGYTDGAFINVYLNGVRLVNGTDYTATNGSDVVLTQAASVSDVLDFETFTQFSLVSSTQTTPTFKTSATLKNDTHEDSDGGRESTLIFSGEQSGGEITTLAEVEASHDGTADDQKGDLIFRTNDGSDGTSPTERLRIDSNGSILTATLGTDNVHLGEGAGDSIASGGNYNVAIGKNALTSNTTGDNNTAVGFEALEENTTASNNVGVGYQAGNKTTTGTQNTFFAGFSGFNNTTGNNNTAVGYDSFLANTTGSNNVALGHSALDANTTADQNTAVGTGAAGALTTGGGNTAIGRLAMGTGVVTGAHNTAVGYLAGDALTSGSSNTFVGTVAGDATTTGADNTAVGRGALGANTTASHNTAVGKDAMVANTTGDAAVAVGKSSLLANTTGRFNTGCGYETLYSNTTGGYNTAVGQFALGANTTASYNVAVGNNALDACTTGTRNVAVGRFSLTAVTTGYDNTFIGEKAGEVLTTGKNNTAIGQYALSAGQTMDNCTAIGHLSGFTVTGDNNTFLGQGAGYNNLTSGTNCTMVGFGALASSATVDNEFTLGNSSVSSLRCADTSISSLSDERDKKNIVDVPLGLDFIKTLRPVAFDWSARDGSRVGKKDFGFVAQELKTAEDATDYADHMRLVQTGELTLDSGKVEMLEADPMKTYPVLIKAVQELSTALDAALARIATLEG